MVWIYLCESCQKQEHGKCDRITPAPPGHYGGAKCSCPCDGDAGWNSPERLEAELKKLVEMMVQNKKAYDDVKQRS